MSTLKKLILNFAIIFVLANIILGILNKRIVPILVKEANVEAKKSSINILRNAGLYQINELLDVNEVYSITKNNKGEIESIDFNIPVLNEALIIIAKNVRNKLKDEEKNINKTLYNMPLGLVSNSVLFYQTGPKVPIKIKYKGNVTLDLKTRVEDYGINSALIEIYVEASVIQTAVVPFKNDDIKVKAEIPIVLKVIKGTNSNIMTSKSSTYSLPLE